MPKMIKGYVCRFVKILHGVVHLIEHVWKILLIVEVNGLMTLLICALTHAHKYLVYLLIPKLIYVFRYALKTILLMILPENA